MQNDLISRSALLFVLSNDYFPAKGEFRRAMDIARFTIQDAPAVDAVEVVRCKDCKHRHKALDRLYCARNYRAVLPVTANDFCSYGERRDEDAGKD